MILTDKDAFAALPADTRALVLLRVGQARDAVTQGKPAGAALTRLINGTLMPHKLTELGNQVAATALQFFPKDDIYLQNLELPENDPKRYQTPPGKRMARLNVLLGRMETELGLLHHAAPKDNALPRSQEFPVRAVLGRYWQHREFPRFTDAELAEVLGSIRQYLTKLPLHEQYGLKMYATRAHAQWAPPHFIPNFRGWSQHNFAKQAIGALLEDSPEHGLVVRPEVKSLLPDFAFYQRFRLTTPEERAAKPAGTAKGR